MIAQLFISPNGRKDSFLFQQALFRSVHYFKIYSFYYKLNNYELQHCSHFLFEDQVRVAIFLKKYLF